MRLIYLPFVLFFITINSFAQINFEKGYFVDKQNNRVNCFIRNYDWKDNPKEFEYKLTENGATETGNPATVNEFVIEGFSKYKSADTRIDLSSSLINALSHIREPEWSQQQLFLKVLVEGKAALYYFEKNGMIRFFYSGPDSVISQLIYKEFYNNHQEYYTLDNEISVNKKFQEQLWTEVRCANTSQQIIENLNYRKSDLIKYFNNYNQCQGKTPTNATIKRSSDLFHLRFAPGLNFSSFSMRNTSSTDLETDFGSQLNARLGIETEYMLPFNKNKWSVVFEPAFQYYVSEKQINTKNRTIDYKSIDFPIGVRYYLFLTDHTKLFINGHYIPGFSINFNSTVKYYNYANPLTYKINPGFNLAFGGGICLKRVSAEIRYYSSRNVMNGYGLWSASYKTFAFILGLRLL